MDGISLLMLILSVSFSSGRNVLSKKMAAASFGESGFFLLQIFMFSAGAAVLLPLAVTEGLFRVSARTVLYSVIYAALLLSAQWNYTVALGRGKVGICAAVYSLGFILPTLSGAAFFGEELGVVNAIGIAVAAAAVLSSAKIKKEGDTGHGGIVNLVLAMLSSGGLGIMQKVQQSSDAADEKGSFVFLAFSFAALVSLAVWLALWLRDRRAKTLAEGNTETNERDTDRRYRGERLAAVFAGLLFGGANFLNTALAGAMDSALFFPLQNVSSIFVSLLLGVIIYKEKLRKKDFVTVALSTVAVVLLVL